MLGDSNGYEQPLCITSSERGCNVELTLFQKLASKRVVYIYPNYATYMNPSVLRYVMHPSQHPTLSLSSAIIWGNKTSPRVKLKTDSRSLEFFFKRCTYCMAKQASRPAVQCRLSIVLSHRNITLQESNYGCAQWKKPSLCE